MFEPITDFITSISAYHIPIPYSLQVSIIVVIIIGLLISAYFFYDTFDIEVMRHGFSWFIFVAVVNLATILIVFMYYHSKSGALQGAPGKPGKKGSIGKKGTSVSCNNCKNNLYIYRVKRSNTICTIPSQPKVFKHIFNMEKYFNDIINQGNRIDYTSFINNILLNQKSATNTKAIDTFSALMNTNNISILLIKAINEYTKADMIDYGSFRHPKCSLPLGDSLYGGIERDMELNSFRVDGNVLYPGSYTPLVSFKAYNSSIDDLETYTIWRANPQIINNPGFKNTIEQVSYKALGDICRFSTIQPRLSECPTISEKCLEEVPNKDIELVFIAINNIEIQNETSGIDYTQSDSYLIENAAFNNIEMFSVWRTPLNTFITNCNTKNNQTENKIVNNTVIYNIINNLSGSLNKYGNVSTSEKTRISNYFDTIQIPKIIVALILCYYYQVDLIKDLVYYVNQAKSMVKKDGKILISEFQVNVNSLTFGELMNLISETKKAYDKYNSNLPSLFNSDSQLRQAKKSKKKNVEQYDPSKEKHLPPMLINVYNDTTNTLLTLPVKIENTNTLLDILNIVFENGIETRVAVDSNGIIEGGTFMNSIQEMILLICKMLTPPNIPVYTIKDECLGTFPFDREREEIIRQFTDIRNDYFQLQQDILLNEKYYEIESIIIVQTETVIFKMAQLCGHITDFEKKIKAGNLEEITTSRIKGLIKIVNDAITVVKSAVESVNNS